LPLWIAGLLHALILSVQTYSAMKIIYLLIYLVDFPSWSAFCLSGLLIFCWLSAAD